MSGNIDALIANFPSTLQENALRQGQMDLLRQKYTQNALNLQQQTGFQNALRDVFGNQSNIDPATGLPRPAAMAPLMQYPQGLDYVETAAKLNEYQQRAAVYNMHTRQYYTNIYDQGVVRPTIEYANSLPAEMPGDERNQKIATFRAERERATIAENGVPDSEAQRWASLPPYSPSWAAGSAAWQQHQAAVAKGWHEETDYGTTPPTRYSWNEVLGGPSVTFDITHRVPYTPTGVAKPEGKPEGFSTATWTDPDGTKRSVQFTRSYGPSGWANVDPNDPNKRVVLPTDAPDLRITPETARGAAPSLEASKTLEILDKNGEVLRTVLAREGRDKPGWVDSATGEPIVVNKAAGESLKEITPTTSSGGRAGAQVIRQEIAGREVLSDLQNAVSLPLGTTTGLLGGVHQGPSVFGALRSDLVRKLTDQDAQLMQASMASMSRELSILMSPVYGGSWAAQQIDPLIPQAGNSVGTTLFKLARIAQSADNALEAAAKAPILSNEQKKYALDLRRQIQEAIPWTTRQALDFARQGQAPKESFADFVKRGGLEGKGPSVPSESSHATLDAAKSAIPQGDTRWYPINTPQGKTQWWRRTPSGTLEPGGTGAQPVPGEQ